MRVGGALLAQERLDPRVQRLLDHAGAEPLERAAQPLLHELASGADALDFGGVLLDPQAHHERARGGDLEAVALERARARVDDVVLLDANFLGSGERFCQLGDPVGLGAVRDSVEPLGRAVDLAAVERGHDHRRAIGPHDHAEEALQLHRLEAGQVCDRLVAGDQSRLETGRGGCLEHAI